MPYSSGWDDGYMDRYPSHQYGYGIPNTMGTSNNSIPTASITHPGGSSRILGGVAANVGDADTLDIFIGGRKTTVRLEGIDAPEVGHRGQVWDALNPWSTYSRSNGYNPLSAITKAFDQPFAWAGKQRVEELIGSGSVSVSLKEKDKYGRYVGDIITHDGKSVAQTLITEGLAHPYQSGPFYSPNVFTDTVRQAWLDAVAKGKGIYGSHSYIAPVEYKHPTLGTILSMLNPLHQSEAYKADRRMAEQYTTGQRAKELGIPTGFASLVSNTQGYIMPASMGGSYFYARGQYNALMRQAGLTENVIDNDDASIATSMYEVGYLAKQGRPPDYLPRDIASSTIAGALVGTLMGGLTGKVGGAAIGTLGGGLLGLGVGMGTPYVTQYDKELTAGGLGAAINEWGASNDWGRLYKDVP